MPEHTQAIGNALEPAFARAADCRIEQQSAARLFASRPFWMVKVNHPAQMNGKLNCRSFASALDAQQAAIAA